MTSIRSLLRLSNILIIFQNNNPIENIYTLSQVPRQPSSIPQHIYLITYIDITYKLKIPPPSMNSLYIQSMSHTATKANDLLPRKPQPHLYSSHVTPNPHPPALVDKNYNLKNCFLEYTTRPIFFIHCSFHNAFIPNLYWTYYSTFFKSSQIDYMHCNVLKTQLFKPIWRKKQHGTPPLNTLHTPLQMYITLIFYVNPLSIYGIHSYWSTGETNDELIMNSKHVSAHIHQKLNL